MNQYEQAACDLEMAANLLGVESCWCATSHAVGADGRLAMSRDAGAVAWDLLGAIERVSDTPYNSSLSRAWVCKQLLHDALHARGGPLRHASISGFCEKSGRTEAIKLAREAAAIARRYQ